MKQQIKKRRQAMIGGVLAIAVEPGEKVFDLANPLAPKLLGIVGNGMPVVNEPAKTVYLSNDDYDAGKHHVELMNSMIQ